MAKWEHPGCCDEAAKHQHDYLGEPEMRLCPVTCTSTGVHWHDEVEGYTLGKIVEKKTQEIANAQLQAQMLYYSTIQTPSSHYTIDVV